VLEAWRWSNFFLAYQGRDDRLLQQRYARLVAGAIESKAPHWRAPLPAASAAGRRVRVGFVSAFFVDGTVGQYFRRWITALERETFEVYVYHVATGHDTVTDDIMAQTDRFRCARATRVRRWRRRSRATCSTCSSTRSWEWTRAAWCSPRCAWRPCSARPGVIR
jgi:predicted O-linked N-acetylglucosamine transferase (SPINDLY family)